MTHHFQYKQALALYSFTIRRCLKNQSPEDILPPDVHPLPTTLCPPPLWRNSPKRVRADSFLRFLDTHTVIHHIRKDVSGRRIGPSQTPLPDNTQQSQETDIYACCGIRTRNPCKRAAAEPRLRPFSTAIGICRVRLTKTRSFSLSSLRLKSFSPGR